LKTEENKKMHFMILDVTIIQNVHGSKKLISKTSKMGGNYMVKVLWYYTQKDNIQGNTLWL
jgi:hypothetical protein